MSEFINVLFEFYLDLKQVEKFADKVLMKKVLAKIGRENHINHLITVMPLIVMVYAIQCYVMWKFSPELQIGDYAITMGIVLSSFISFMVFYDNNHHVLIYEDKLHIYFGLTGTNRVIEFKDIETIIAPEEEVNFSNLIIKTKEDQKNHVFYFVDHPFHVKKLIEKQISKIKGHQEENNDDHDSFNKAA